MLVGPGERGPGDGWRLRPPGADADQPGLLDARREHRALVHQLLDLVQQRLAALAVDLAGLIAEERVDVRIATVRANPAGDHEGLDPRRGVAGRTAADP